MSKPKDWVSFINEEILPYLEKWPGIFTLIIATNIADWWFSKYALEISLFHLPTESIIVFEVSIFILSLLVWIFVIRRLPKFSVDQIGILIALTGSDQATDEELIRLHRKIDTIIIQEGFKGKIIVKSVPIRLVPKEEKKAHSLRDKCNARLIIWGNVDRGNINNQAHTIFVPIFFSYKVNLNQRDFAPLHRNISNILKQRKWLIADNNNAIDRTYLAENIEEISIYIIGLVLYFNKDLDKAIDLLLRILKKYQSKQFQSEDDKIAMNNIRNLIENTYGSKIRSLELWPGSKKIEESIKLANSLTEEIKDFGFNSFALLIEAQVAFAQRNLSVSRKICHECFKYYPKNPAPYFSLAFLAYYEKDLDDGFKYLFQALGNNVFLIGDQFISLARWYIESLNEDPKKLYLNFPLGIMYNDLIKDKILAIEYLEKFVNNYKEDESKIFKKMIYESKKRLKKNLSLNKKFGK